MLDNSPSPIAIIGIGCRLPGDVKNTEDLWELLVEGKNTWTAVPPERFNEHAFYHPNADNHGTTNHAGGHFIGQNIAAFDAGFFGISPVEASAMDPQQRLLLETTYEAFEDAGIPIESTKGSNTSVFVAMFTRDYDRNLYKDPEYTPKYHTTGTGDAIMSNRLSYIFDFKGPSLTLDTGCSGSMVALHLACQSLRIGESGIALVSGVNLILSPDHMIGMSNLHMLNDAGRSYSFDERGSGYGRGEGIVTVLLKPLQDALQSGDKIRCIIRNTAVNQDGKTSGITLPSQAAQEIIGRSVYSNIGLDPREIPYIEAHGTGTAAGDLAELGAIAKVFCGKERDSLYVGSIKSNIGHLESSSGLAGLIKTVLILEKGFIPPNADFQHPKKSLHLEKWKIKVPTELTPWPQSFPGIRRASVNSFGYGGTNAHAILESASDACLIKHNGAPLENMTKTYPSISPIVGDHPLLFSLSGKSKEAVLNTALSLMKWATKNPLFEAYCHDLAFTLSKRRSIMPYRRSFIAGTHQELINSLQSMHNDFQYTTKSSPIRRIGFIFSGQGAQWVGMGRDLLTSNSYFAQSIMKSDAILRGFGASWSLVDELMFDKSKSRIHKSEIAQPASTALQIALVDFLKSLAIIPDMVLGHSSGEIAAAYTTGALSHTEALNISYHRSFLSMFCERFVPQKGAMLVTGLGEKDILPIIRSTRKGIVSLACVNSPSSTTVSGDEEAISEVQEILDKSGVFNRKLQVDTAYHSHHMERVSKYYRDSLGLIQSHQKNPKIRFISSVTTDFKDDDFSSEYWVSNLISTVRFSDALQNYCQAELAYSSKGSTSTYTIIEIGPHSVLKGPIQQIISPRLDVFEFSYLPTLVRGQSAVRKLLELAGNLFERQYPVDIEAFNAVFREPLQFSPNFLPGLPNYPWDHSNLYWHESRLSKLYRQRRHPHHDLLGVRLITSTELDPIWRLLVDVTDLPWLTDHMVDNLVIFPGSGYICMAIEAVCQLFFNHEAHGNMSAIILYEVKFLKALVITSSSKVEVQISLKTHESGGKIWYEFCISALSESGIWNNHCRGSLKIQQSSEKALNGLDQCGISSSFDSLTVSKAAQRILEIEASDNTTRLHSAEIYTQLQSQGNRYGPLFAAIKTLCMAESDAVSYLSIPDVQSVMPAKYMQPHIVHPSTLDALLHSSLPLYSNSHGPGSVMPVSIGRLAISASIPNIPDSELLAYTALDSNGLRSASASLMVFEKNRESCQLPVLEVSDMEIRGLGEEVQPDFDLPRSFSYEMKWAPDIDLLNYSELLDSSIHFDLVEYLNLFQFKYAASKLIAFHRQSSNTIGPVLISLSNLKIDTFLSQSLLDQTHNLLPDTQDIVILDLGDFEDFTKAVPLAQTLLRPHGCLILLNGSDLVRDILPQKTIKSVQLSFNGTLDFGIIALSRIQWVEDALQPIQIIYSDDSSCFPQNLCIALQSSGLQVSIKTWETADFTPSNVIRIIVDSGEIPVLVDPSEERWKSIVDLMGSKSRVLWISIHENASAAKNPEKGLITGFARCARAENEHLRIVTFDVQEALEAYLPDLLDRIRDALFILLGNSSEESYMYRAGRVLIGRLIPKPDIDRYIAIAAKKPVVEKASYTNIERSLALLGSHYTPGGDLYFTDYKVKKEDHLARQSGIAVRAQSLSADDPMFFSTIDRTSKSGFIGEISGIVIDTSTGESSKSTLETGNRVCALVVDPPPFANYIQVPSENLIRLPESISFAVGALLPSALITAFHCLVNIASLQKNQAILVYGAAEDIGRAAINIALQVGAQVFASVSSAAERESLMKLSGIESSRIFLEDDQHIRSNIFQLTAQKGVEVVLNPIPQTGEPSSTICLAAFGIFIQVAEQEPRKKGSTPQLRVPSIDRNSTFVSLDIVALIRARPQLLATIVRGINEMSLFHSTRTFTSENHQIIPMRDLAQRFKHMSTTSRKQFRKVVLEADETTQVAVLTYPHLLSVDSKPVLETNGTYIIAGGLGSLGQEICTLLADRGAKHIVLLSRSIFEPEKKNILESRLQHHSEACEIHHIVCDISSLLAVEHAVSIIREMGLPPVKGIIQSAVVLKDSSIQRMSLRDFQLPLETKFQGTKNLQKSFESSALDFFIMLSSLTALVGTMGQANYTAGNAYLDAIAQNDSNLGTRYLALDLGLIEGTAAYQGGDGAIRIHHLTRQGMIPVKIEELLGFLNFAIYSVFEKNDFRQAAFGIDGQSVAQAENPTPTLQGPMFAHVRLPGTSSAHQKGFIQSRSREESFEDACTFDGVISALTKAIIHRFAALLGLRSNQVNPELPLLDFGFDSLTAIEMKNWISKEFDSAVQASEILDQPSISALAERVAIRSGRIQSHLKGKSRDVQKAPLPERHFFHGPDEKSQETGDIDEQKSLSYTALPLPDLKSTLDLFLNAIKSFVSKQDYASILQKSKSFSEKSGRTLQNRLVERVNDGSIENWQYDLQVDGIYLKRRDPVHPYGTFWISHVLTKITHSQAKRAAVIATAAYNFKQRLDAGDIDAVYINEEPLCMESLPWLFNATRIPCIGKDKMCRHPGNNHLIVLRRGHIFRVNLEENGRQRTCDEMEAIFKSILQISDRAIPSVAALTADERNRWAAIRGSMCGSIDTIINTVESSLFIICLDDGAPKTATERGNQFLLGDPANRWSDKSLQFVICENGTSALVAEHSMLDAASVTQINKFVIEATMDCEQLTDHQQGSIKGEGIDVRDSYKELLIQITPELELRIKTISEQFQKTHQHLEITKFFLPVIGSKFLKTYKTPAKAGCQVIIQLASLIFFGRQYPSWEALTMMQFHKGRLDWMQTVSPAMLAFCSAAVNNTESREELKSLFYQAVRIHANTTSRISRGKGFLAHLEALREVVHEDDVVPEFFQDQAWKMMCVTSARKLKTDTSVDLLGEEAGFYMPDEESFLIHFEVEDERCLFSVQGTKGRTDRFRKAIECAAEKMRVLLEV